MKIFGEKDFSIKYLVQKYKFAESDKDFHKFFSAQSCLDSIPGTFSKKKYPDPNEK